MSTNTSQSTISPMKISSELELLFSKSSDRASEITSAKMEATMWSVELFRHEVKSICSDAPDTNGIDKAKSFIEALKTEYGVDPDVITDNVRLAIIDESLNAIVSDNARLRVRCVTMDIAKDMDAKAIVVNQIEFLVGAGSKLLEMKAKILGVEVE
jgi:hypothetical protein